jgi:hypothetical protein
VAKASKEDGLSLRQWKQNFLHNEYASSLLTFGETTKIEMILLTPCVAWSKMVKSDSLMSTGQGKKGQFLFMFLQ